VYIYEETRYDKNLKAFYKLCEAISGYYRADRYPSLGTKQLTCEDVEKNLEEAKKFIQTMFPEEKLGG